MKGFVGEEISAHPDDTLGKVLRTEGVMEKLAACVRVALPNPLGDISAHTMRGERICW